ncbi:MAG: MFS transporter [Gordonia sp.]|uniref:MFS transporter n=1 Tax=Gordonia sp. (in: high G+C Gram-positive bacteria) TaxID=84139 RepID=UPI000C5C6573|nr:MFS transporter [Gordonia sp. (in: high G+C Gram-positive bacteria)]MAU80537.1 MFS transporter [Gordonia sp. (in: high G+C Gram-positive bacteria)]
MTAPPRPAQAMTIWLVGLAVYFVAVLHRSSLGVAGLLAAERFDISASQLSTFVVLQLLIYALMQVPVGLLVDRFGPRRVLLTGTLILTSAQLSFAFADSYLWALSARFFVGVGDAMTFVCVLRLVTTWFPIRRIPLMTQLTGVLGQLGAVAAAVPMTWALSTLGWTHAYIATAALGGVLLVATLVVVRDSAEARSVSGPMLGLAGIKDSLKASWEHPGTRLGFWMHFSTQFSATVLGLLWGYPFFVEGQGLSSATAGLLLTVMVLSIMAFGPTFAWLITRWPWHRSTLVLLVVASIATTWAVVLAWPGAAPLWMLVVLVVICGMGGPASMVGFDLGRTSNPVFRVSTATGIINQGGFLASLTTAALIGLLLDWRPPDGVSGYPAEAFTWAMSAQFVLWAIGATQIWRYRRKGRARLLRDDPELWSQQSGRPVPN